MKWLCNQASVSSRASSVLPVTIQMTFHAPPRISSVTGTITESPAHLIEVLAHPFYLVNQDLGLELPEDVVEEAIYRGVHLGPCPTDTTLHGLGPDEPEGLARCPLTVPRPELDQHLLDGLAREDGPEPEPITVATAREAVEAVLVELEGRGPVLVKRTGQLP